MKIKTQYLVEMKVADSEIPWGDLGYTNTALISPCQYSDNTLMFESFSNIRHE